MMTSLLSLQSSLERNTAGQDLLGLTPIPEDTRQRFLRFTLSNEPESLLPLEDVMEVFRLKTSDILPIPEMANSTLGIYRWRGSLLWLVDLNLLVGNPSVWHQNSQLENLFVIVVQIDQKSVGLVVEYVDDVTLIEPTLIEPSTEFSDPALSPYIVGYLPEHKGVILNANAIINQIFQGSR